MWMLLAGRGFGKQVALDTPLATPDGWTTMRDVSPGDWLFDEVGRPCRVLAKYSSPVTKAYRVMFSDGAEIVADAPHQWVTWTHRDRKQYLRYELKTDFPEEWPTWRGNLTDCYGNITGSFGPQIRTTQEIVDTLRQDTTREDLNHCIPVALYLQLQHKNLPIDPWTLGYWIGNGDARGPVVTAGSWRGEFDGDHVCAKLIKAGFPHSRRDFLDKGQSRIGIRGFNTPQDKLIPTLYLRSSPVQRLELLRGLMDSDGHGNDASSHVEFCTVIKVLADQVSELVLTLGERVSRSEGRATLDGVDRGPKYRVTWRPSLHNPFSLPRKARTVSEVGSQGIRLRHRMIVSAEPIDPVPMACITVDSPNSMYLAGRAMIPTHNTRTGAEYIRARIDAGARHIALIAPTAADARDVMVRGESGLLSIYPPNEAPVYQPSNLRITWANGAEALLFSADEPERLRGPNHDVCWADELGAWRYADDAWAMMLFGLRLGDDPRVVVTTTPRPTRLIRELISDPNTVVTCGSTYENKGHLAPAFFSQVIRKYEGTRLGRQEIDAELLEDVPGALWNRALLELAQPPMGYIMPPLIRVVVAIDPAATSGEEADETGIIVAGKDDGGRGYVLADLSGRYTPTEWAKVAIAAYRTHRADRIVAEVNNGGEMVGNTVRMIDPNVSFTAVHATRGKLVRAEPVSALYEQGRIRHMAAMPQLEDQMVCFTPELIRSPGNSPDRVDACVARGTLVTTKRGDVAIEVVQAGDMVLTRRGWRKVIAARLTRRNAPALRIKAGNGSLTATGDHLVWTERRGFCRLDALVCGDILLSCRKQISRSPFGLTGSNSAAHLIQTRHDRREFTIPPIGTTAASRVWASRTLRYGERQMAIVKFLRDTLFTTRMTILSTIRQITWNALPALNMPSGISRYTELRRGSPISLRFVRWLPSGTGAQRAMSGTGFMASTVGKIGNPVSIDAMNAGLCSKRSMLVQKSGFVLKRVGDARKIACRPINIWSRVRSAANSFGKAYIDWRPRLAPAYVVRSCESAGTADVFDLMVEGDHEFFAGGLLVHNCVWALTELLVEEISNSGMFEFVRRQSELVEAKKRGTVVTGRPEMSYAIGCLEWEAQEANRKAVNHEDIAIDTDRAIRPAM